MIVIWLLAIVLSEGEQNVHPLHAYATKETCMAVARAISAKTEATLGCMKIEYNPEWKEM